MSFYKLEDNHLHEINCLNCFYCKTIPGTVRITKSMRDIKIRCAKIRWFDSNGEPKTFTGRLGTWSDGLCFKKAEKCEDFESMNDDSEQNA